MRTFEECLEVAEWETAMLERRYCIKAGKRRRRKVLRGAYLLLASVTLLIYGMAAAAEDKPAESPELPKEEPVKRFSLVTEILGAPQRETVVVTMDEKPVCMILPEVEMMSEPEAPAEPVPVYYDVPLSHELQDKLRSACEESGVPMDLALAVIWAETNFENTVGDDGESAGYMQIQEKWHRDRMERLGVADLSDPEGNFRVGCDLLAELLDKHPLAYALTCYNSGKVRVSEYSERVMAYQEALKNKKAVGPWWEPTA